MTLGERAARSGTADRPQGVSVQLVRRPTSRLAATLALLLIAVTACAGAPPTLESLPPVRQLPPEPTAAAGDAGAPQRPLDDAEIDEVLRRALGDSAVAEALGAGTVDQVYVQTGSDQGMDGRWATAAFLFEEPASGWSRPSPWSAMCDIGRPSEDWLGVAAAMELGDDGAPASSPIWTNGVSCVSFFLPEGPLPGPTRTGGSTEAAPTASPR